MEPLSPGIRQGENRARGRGRRVGSRAATPVNAAPVTPVAAAPSPAAPATPVVVPADNEELPDAPQPVVPDVVLDAAPPPPAADDDEAAVPPPPASDDDDDAPRRWVAGGRGGAGLWVPRQPAASAPRRSRSPRTRQPAALAPRRSRSPRARQPAAATPRRLRSPRARQPAQPAAPAAPAWERDIRELLATVKDKGYMEVRETLRRYGFISGPTYPGKSYYDTDTPITYPCYYDIVGKNYGQHQELIRSKPQLMKYLEGALALASSGGAIRLESARRVELQTTSADSQRKTLAKLMVRRFQRKLRFAIQEGVAAALSDSPRLTPSPDEAVEVAKDHGWNSADLVEVFLFGQDADSSDDDANNDPEGPRILGLLHRGDLCTLKADDKVIVKVVSVGRRKVEVTFINWHEGMTKSVRPSELVPMNLDEGRQPRRHVERLAVGTRLVGVPCVDGNHCGKVRSVTQYGYEVRFADGDEGFVSIKNAHLAAARALEKKRPVSSSSAKLVKKKRR